MEVYMNFCTIRDLRNNSKKLWSDDDVIITNNGKPKGILIKTDDEKFLNTLSLIASARALWAMNSIKEGSKAKGYFSEDEIDKEIQSVRNRKK